MHSEQLNPNVLATELIWLATVTNAQKNDHQSKEEISQRGMFIQSNDKYLEKRSFEYKSVTTEIQHSSCKISQSADTSYILLLQN